MHHVFTIKSKEGKIRKLNSRLVGVGDLKDTVTHKGYSFMAKSVGYPTAIVVDMILEGHVKRTGVLSPIYKDLYYPIMERLDKEYGI